MTDQAPRPGRSCADIDSGDGESGQPEPDIDQDILNALDLARASD